MATRPDRAPFTHPPGTAAPRLRRRPSLRAVGKNTGTLAMTADLAGDAAEILERDYGIDAGEVLSMNVDTVETVTSGTQSDSPDFAKIVNDPEHWEQYGQRTWDATTVQSGEDAEGNPEYSGAIFSNVSKGTTVDQRDNYGTRAPYYGWWGTALLNRDEYDADNISAKFHVVQGGQLNEGFCFNVTQSDGTYDVMRQDGTPWREGYGSGETNSATGNVRYPTDEYGHYSATGTPIKAKAISGYFITYSHHDWHGSFKEPIHRALWKIKDWRLDNNFSVTGSLNHKMGCSPGNTGADTSENFWLYPGATYTSDYGEQIECLAAWEDDGTNIDYEVECKDGNIKVYRTDNDVDSNRGTTVLLPDAPRGVKELVADVNDSTYANGTYGFWGQNCEQKGQSQVTDLNVTIEKTYVKSFGDIVYEPTWTEGALHMLINMDTATDRTMLGTDGGRESSTRYHRGQVAPSRLPPCARLAAPRRRLPLLTADLAGDAAEILERDYGIDAGEVLSMNVDTVETKTNAAAVKASDASVILGSGEGSWGSYRFTWPANGYEGFNSNGATPPTTPNGSKSAWDIAEKDVLVPTVDDSGNTTYKQDKESVVLFKNSVGAFDFFRNDAEWQNSSQDDADGKFVEATYKTTIGGDTELIKNLYGGSPNWNACGEAWWFFKLTEDNKEGYAICIDNHGYYGCGIFERFWNQLYVCHYDWNNPLQSKPVSNDNLIPNDAPTCTATNPSYYVPHTENSANITILKKWRVSPMQLSPRYEVTVREKDGKATITVDPDEVNAPYSYIGGQEWERNGYYIGYQKGSEHTDATDNCLLEGIEHLWNGGSVHYEDGTSKTSNAISQEYYQNKELYDWDWPGSTQDAVSCEIELSPSILSKDTTQAFAAYLWNGTYFANNSVSVTKQVNKSFGDIVYEPTWTDGALHMLINMDDASDRTMLGQDGGRESSTRLLGGRKKRRSRGRGLAALLATRPDCAEGVGPLRHACRAPRGRRHIAGADTP